MSVSSSGAITTTGNVAGTASYASNAELLDGLDSTVFTLTSSFAAQTASFTAFTASQNILNGKYATTGSNTFTGIQTINSNLIVTGSITAQTLVVQTVSSSVIYSSGSNVFGNNISNTQTFTGSVNITGSQTISNGDLTLSGNRSIFLSNSNPAAGVIRFYNATSGSTKSAIGSYFNVADEGNLEFLTGGTTTRMIISSSGYVGIGTNTPTAIMQIQGAQAGVSGKNLTISYNGTYYAEYTEKSITAFNNELIFGTGTGGTEKMRILSGGNVGIGVSNPSAILHLASSVAGTSSPFFIQNSNSSGTGARIVFAPNSNFGVGDLGAAITATSTAGGYDVNLVFTTYKSGVGSATVMTIAGSTKIVTMSNNFVASAGFNSYDGDGLFAANATYCSINTPGSSNRIRFGYNDYGSGQYWGRIGFFQTTNWSLGGIGSAGNDFSIGTAYNGSQLYIYSNGNYAFSGSNVSDRRKKTNINYITTNQLDNILKLKPATFNKIADEVVSENIHTGFIAQDILELGIPNLVMGSDEGGYGLDYNGILSLAVKAIQELKAEIDELKNK
jgi:hypothetical protein